MPTNLENSAVAAGLQKVRFHSNPKEGNAKECSNYRTIALISHVSKVMLKILQARLQQYVNHELPDVQAGFRKGRATKLPTFTGSWKKQESSRKTSASAYLRLLTCLLAILIPACDSSSPAFHMMYCAYKFNKQGDNIQP